MRTVPTVNRTEDSWPDPRDRSGLCESFDNPGQDRLDELLGDQQRRVAAVNGPVLAHIGDIAELIRVLPGQGRHRLGAALLSGAIGLQRQPVVVVPANDPCIEHQPTAGGACPERELLILSARDRKVFVETTDLPEQVAAQRQIPGANHRNFKARIVTRDRLSARLILEVLLEVDAVATEGRLVQPRRDLTGKPPISVHQCVAMAVARCQVVLER